MPQTNSTTSCVLFYAHACPHSREALAKLQTLDLEREFDLVDVTKDPVPTGVSTVPTVYEKRTCTLHQGAEVFDLLARMADTQVVGYEFRPQARDTITFSDLEFTSSARGDAFSWIPHE